MRQIARVFAAVGLLTVVAMPAVAETDGDVSGPPDRAPRKTVAVAAPHPDSVVPRSGLPKLLSDRDIALYRKIFEYQEDGRWREADGLIRQLSDRTLMGHVLFQRYMHPTAWRSSFAELSGWLKHYADHPGADRIYRLALRRKPRGARAPAKPVDVVIPSTVAAASDEVVADETVDTTADHSDHRRIWRVQRQIRRLVSRGRTKQALHLLDADRTRRLFDPVSFDKSRAMVARGFYHDGDDAEALRIAGRGAARSGAAVPATRWWAGLAAWRLGKFERAAEYFEGIARDGTGSGWMVSAGAYWAARADLMTRRPEKVNAMLAIAAEHPRTFYGMLATRALGFEPEFDWTMPTFDEADMDLLVEVPATKRALALVEVGETALAEDELRRFIGKVPPALSHVLLALATEAHLSELAFRLGVKLHDSRGLRLDVALYPVPIWEPAGGYTIDRALMYAMMRQESGFRTEAKSTAGAHGLMQLMPRTAGHIAGKRFRGSSRRELFEPELNLSLGQKYIEHLLANPDIDGNLFYAAAAYNCGPGNLGKWRKRVDYKDDPLLFIESIPARETRVYVERVLTNLWIYRHRLGQPTPGLDAVAAGEWPRYTALDPLREDVAFRGN